MGVRAMQEVEELRARFAGPVVAPGDASYDDVRRVHNGLVDKHPALIVRCAGAEDVVAALDPALTVWPTTPVRLDTVPSEGAVMVVASTAFWAFVTVI